MDPRAEWPMDSYISAWRLFRRLSDENQLTAEHLLSRRRWPRHARNLRIVDFGCGDGMLVEALILASPQPVSTVHLVDPDPELLEQAKRRVEGLNLIQELKITLGRAEDVVKDVTRNADAALAVHLVYLLKETELKKLLAGLALGVSLFIVMDKRTSIFTTLWERTAPKYHSRLLNAREIIESLRKDAYAVERTEFDTHLTNPLTFRDDIRDLVISLLCYKNFRELNDETQLWVRDVLSGHTASGRVVCDCVCYEVVRLL